MIISMNQWTKLGGTRGSRELSERFLRETLECECWKVSCGSNKRTTAIWRCVETSILFPFMPLVIWVKEKTHLFYKKLNIHQLWVCWRKSLKFSQILSSLLLGEHLTVLWRLMSLVWIFCGNFAAIANLSDFTWYSLLVGSKISRCGIFAMCVYF